MACWTDVNWAAPAIENLRKGNGAIITPHGNSMHGRVESGQKVTLLPVKEELQIGDVVLVKVGGSVYLHLIKDVQLGQGGVIFKIGNNKGGVNGWVGLDAIYGVAPYV